MLTDLYTEQYHRVRYPELLAEGARRRLANSVGPAPSLVRAFSARLGAALVGLGRRLEALGPASTLAPS